MYRSCVEATVHPQCYLAASHWICLCQTRVTAGLQHQVSHLEMRLLSDKGWHLRLYPAENILEYEWGYIQFELVYYEHLRR